ncbi:MAG TPA: ABC transporter permease, partial [Spirochaetota bacterium]|nr:ABC transporter permease [Spirochaetota bacterium]
EHFKQIKTKPATRITLAVIMLYTFIFLLSWIRFPEFSQVQDHTVYEGSPSLLEKIYSPAREESYSAPLAEYQLHNNTPNNGLHLMGTDINGNDVLLNGLLSIKTAFIIGILTMLLAIPIGIVLGLLAGYYGRKTDTVITYTYSTLRSIPEILLLLVLMNALGQGLIQICIALGITTWIGLCRLIRGQTIALKNSEYVQAARAMGQSDFKIMWRHILPNLSHIILITSVLRFSALIMTETILSYLGIGVSGEQHSWGLMIDQARVELMRDPAVWWNITTAFVLMFLLILSVNLFGDTLRDILDPRLKQEQS